MKSIYVLGLFIAFVVLFMLYWSFSFDYDERDTALKEVSKNLIYVVPSFSFKSKEYKEFVYEK